MRFGISPCTQSPPAGEHLDRLVDQIIEQAQQAERYGFDSFLLTEHHQQLCHRLLGRPASESGPFCQSLGARGGQGVGRVASHGLDVDYARHADPRGTDPYNQALSQRRVTAIRDALVKAGVPGDKIQAGAFGEERLKCSQSTEPCWQLDRRVEVLISSVK